MADQAERVILEPRTRSNQVAIKGRRRPRRLRRRAETHKDALESLLHWHNVAKRAAWQHLMNVRADFPHADRMDMFTVFNIGGNKYRLIAVIKYKWQIIYVRQILTHAEYDEGKWRA